MRSMAEVPSGKGVEVFVLVRTVIYAALGIGLLVVLLPPETLSAWGVARPASIGPLQIIGIAVGVLGTALAAWSVLTFAFIGRGTPVPFDPPRRLVETGPYRFVRNPMAMGVGLLLAGIALFYESATFGGLTVLFYLFIHLMVILYEEPTLRRMFGEEYEAYLRRVRRWVPRL